MFDNNWQKKNQSCWCWMSVVCVYTLGRGSWVPVFLGSDNQRGHYNSDCTVYWSGCGLRCTHRPLFHGLNWIQAT